MIWYKRFHQKSLSGHAFILNGNRRKKLKIGKSKEMIFQDARARKNFWATASKLFATLMHVIGRIVYAISRDSLEDCGLCRYRFVDGAVRYGDYPGYLYFIGKIIYSQIYKRYWIIGRERKENNQDPLMSRVLN